jgi:hypothetical protein
MSIRLTTGKPGRNMADLPQSCWETGQASENFSSSGDQGRGESIPVEPHPALPTGAASAAPAFSSADLSGDGSLNFSESLQAIRLRIVESKARVFGYFDDILSGYRGIMRVSEIASLCDVKPSAVKAWAIDRGGLEIIRGGRLGYCVHLVFIEIIRVFIWWAKYAVALGFILGFVFSLRRLF